jgi:hypothetical protein
MSKRRMVEGLLDSHELAITALSPEECARQFLIWTDHVASALAAADMIQEHRAWTEAKARIRFYDDDSTFETQSESMKAILVGILDKLEETEPSHELFPADIVEGTKRYVEKIAAQANGCYQKGWYDACAVMVRRLIETLIIDCFEQHNIASRITDPDGNYYGLEKLIAEFLKESQWHIPRPMRTHLPKLIILKGIGDSSAHGHLLTTRKQIDDLSIAIVSTFQGLIDIAYFHKTA